MNHSPLHTHLSYRQKLIIAELVETERTYYSKLTLLYKSYYVPSLSCLTQSQHMTIFTGVLPLLTLHSYLSPSLFLILDDSTLIEDTWIEELIKIFDKYVEMLKTYSIFVSNNDKAYDCVKSLLQENQNKSATIKESKQFKYICNNITQQPNSPNGIFSLLIAPVQRVPRYELLFKELSKDGNESIQRLTEQVHIVNQYINDTKKYNHDNEQMKLVINNIIGFKNVMGDELVVTGRQVITIRNVGITKGKKIHKRILVLFNDVVVFCKQVDEHWKVVFGATLMNCIIPSANEDLDDYHTILKKLQRRNRHDNKKVFPLLSVGNYNGKIQRVLFAVWELCDYPSLLLKIEIVDAIRKCNIK
ncbi:DH domain-containing protein [Entamoeba marina]